MFDKDVPNVVTHSEYYGTLKMPSQQPEIIGSRLTPLKALKTGLLKWRTPANRCAFGKRDESNIFMPSMGIGAVRRSMCSVCEVASIHTLHPSQA